MKKLIKIDNIMFRVKDLDASAKFYSEVLGLKQVWRDDEHKMIGFVFSESDSIFLSAASYSFSDPIIGMK